MDKRRLLRWLLVIVFIVGVVLLVVGGVFLYLHYNTKESHPSGPVDQVTNII